MTSRLTFHGGADSVTGSNFLLDTGGAQFLIDCGLFQGGPTDEKKNNEPFPYDPSAINALFVTHAHLDHTGRIPQLVRGGFHGKIYSTPPTKDLGELVLRDNLEVFEKESQNKNREAPYTNEDIHKTLSLWETVNYHHGIALPDNVSAELKNTGHILGSAMVEFSRGGKTIVFTGDIGNMPDPLLPDPEPLLGALYLVIEGVYGDRTHEDRAERREMLEDIIESTVKNKGVLLIPAFSIERTQELLFEIKSMLFERHVPSLPVFLDSPLAIDATKLYKKHHEFLKKSIREFAAPEKELFSFPGLRKTHSVEESKGISRTANPKIIIAGSGMSNGGRILFHEREYLSLPETTLLIVGYQAPGSLGRLLEEGASRVSILGEEIEVHARVFKISGYSSHADKDALFSFVVRTADAVKKVFVVTSEPKTGAFFAQRLRDNLGINAQAPQEGERAELDF